MAPRASHPIVRQWQRIIRQVRSEYSPATLRWLLRCGLVTGQKSKTSGFILPTVTLMLLMMSLVVGVLVFRSFNRTAQVIGQKQQRVLYNAATPAIERGKAKIEYVFNSAGLPALPSDEALVTELANDATYTLGDEERIDVNRDNTLDNAWVYSVDGDGDGTKETVVAYSLLTYASRVVDLNSPATTTTTDDTTLDFTSVDANNTDARKAKYLIVRNGPINLTGSSTKAGCTNVNLSPLAGWQPVSGSQYRKAIQVHAVVINPNTGVAATLEMQQDKVGNLGNKWGAWFRYDLASNAGGTFNWNGAMYTHGNFFLTPDSSANTTRLYQISSASSCIYDANASEITMKGTGDNDPSPNFQGQFVVGNLAENKTTVDGTFTIDPYVVSGTPTTVDMSRANDSVKGAATGNASDSSRNTGVEPSDIALDPIMVLTEDKNQYANGTDTTASLVFATGQTGVRVSPESDWQRVTTGGTYQRIGNSSAERPYVDDLYRADNRWGPSARYNQDYGLSGSNLAGSVISGNDALTSNGPASLVGAETDFGLDGYWERRARRIGVRVVVGERLELGNAFGFTGDGKTLRNPSATSDPQVEDDPLFPGNLGTTAGDPADGTGMDEANADLTYNIGDSDKTDQRSHELRQWRSLRDNLAAVQATAVYHYKSDNGTDALGQYPVACMATTVHPGTQETDERSRSFLYSKFDFNSDGDYLDSNVNGLNETVARLNTDFFSGQGTNGMEFTVPFTGASTGTPEWNFKQQYDDSNSPLRIALTNLAYFAGDWKSSQDNGAYPPTQDSSTVASADKRMRPDPTMTMWGNFSNLRRIIQQGDSYDSLSPADQTTLHTAACTIGVLAHNLSTELYNLLVQTNQLANDSTLASQFQSLNTDMRKYIDGDGEGVAKLPSTLKDDTLDGTCGVTTGSNKLDGAVELNNMVNSNNPRCQSLKAWADANGYGAAYTSAASSAAFLTTYGGEFYGQYTIDDWRQVLTNDVSSKLPDFENLINAFEQASGSNKKIASIFRDRVYGFRPGALNFLQFVSFSAGSTWSSDWDPNTGLVTVPGLTAKVKTSCNPGLLGPYSSAVSTPSQVGDVAFALSLCKTFETTELSDTVRYPALFYLFPMASHYHNGALINTTVKDTAKAAGIPEASQYRDLDNNRATTSDIEPINTYVDVTSRGFNATTNIIYRPVEDGLANCSIAACSVGTRNDVVERGTTNNTTTDDEAMDDFATYLGVKPFVEVTPATTEDLTDAKLPITAAGSDRVHTIFVDTDKDGTVDESPVDGVADTTKWYPAFLDTAFFDGRQQMLVRALSMDVDLMRRTNITNTNCTLVAPTSDTTDANGNCWLPLPTIDRSSDKATRTGAIIYAAREDAIREDAISRPAANTWANCNTLTKMVSTNASTCRTNLFAGSAYGQDPPLNTNTGLSPKAVDFVPDPDRRPHGFRLRNGSDLRRMSGGSAFTNDNSRGLSFVTPNSLYVQGNFNLHTQNEFNTALDATWSNFYTRTNVNSNFATPANDNWRVTELAADAVTVLSESFCAGFIDRGIMKLQVDCDADGAKDDNHSFRAISGPSYTSTNASNVNGSNQINTSNRWWRENINGINSPVDFTTGATAWPILISRNGFPVYNHDNATTVAKQQYGVKNAAVQDFAPFRDSDLSNGINSNPVAAEQPRDYINIGTSTTLNAVVISGINPARAYQPDGAMPIFLRAIENWGTNTLSFAGSLIQLNFSSYATGLQDQDAWEPNDAPSTDDNLNAFYEPPVRAWGYDVALQYAPAGPVAQRFRTSSNIRSEFYRELAIDDPYINNLRCAKYDSDNDGDIDVNDQRIDTRLTATECP